MGHDRYDAVVVGAGPAGSAAAMSMAQNNLSVALIERGEQPGSKNMFGGSLSRKPTAEAIPEFWKEAPLERAIVNEELWLMDKTSAVKVGFTGLEFNKSPYNKFSVIRSKFDPWFADQAVKAGAQLMTSTLVEELVYEKTGLLNKKVAGVELDSGEIIHADVVLLAEGASAALTQEAGLREEIKPSSLFLYVKEELGLPAEKIESRFNLEPGEGANIGMLGYPGSGIIGKGGIWTNQESISVVVGGYLNQIINKGVSPYQLLSRFKEHSLISRLLAGAEPIAYKAHTIPKGGYNEIPQLYGDGVLVAGDAAMMVTGRRGADLAILTGLYAAEVIAQARAAQDYSAEILKGYEKRIMNSFFMENIKEHKDRKEYYQNYSDSDFLLTKAANDAAYRFFKVGLQSKKDKMKTIRKDLFNMQPTDKLVSDLYHGLKNWGDF
ncbi:FAD-dependent oxidoreductase [Acetohalobium arabaticum]|uniref:FAD-dependent pyridine nucleotide-disulfide oxidoreductase n=1 Tax=Acetohalobium arabaticum (strain ATCC 49924 / DSM 5501 / Z-7288) TaxID=574087 RepID=D9QSK1_ACEAZ|nr:FAD-dependent oxidoreductase [Acetohalobium arabaticum]ADL13464.1 FAD-dependent pyridine nucleotide-disulfide oxidoreductase [Acetohalobium arabaticum DSM 5501]